jgi:hypothetical protein
MEWTKLSAGTMQCMPERNFTYQIWKVRTIIDNGTSVITYHLNKLTESDWLHLGAADSFAEAKGLAHRDYAQAT